ncbi:MAG: DUF308 domain-containing protein [Solirubrobacterales bacterium]|nr:DUF308 domain-containing protein [Solirubrobacterales bacterium]
MPSPQDQTSLGVRDKAKDGAELRDERAHVFRNPRRPPSSHTATNFGLEPMLERVASYWWIELLIGVAWVAIALVVLKFNHASVTTVGILVGLMFLVFAAEDFLLASLDRSARWLWVAFGLLLTAGGILALIHPTSTFAGFADIIGFIFLVIGVQWMVQAFAERPINSLWWMTLISGILMTVLAFWVSDKLFIERAYTLLIFAGVWAMTNGVIAIVRAFQIREFAHSLTRPLSP